MLQNPSDPINRDRLKKIEELASRAAGYRSISGLDHSLSPTSASFETLEHEHPLSNREFRLSELDTPYTLDPNINIEDSLARDQGWVESMFKGLVGRFVTKTLGTAALSASTLLNVPTSILVLLDNRKNLSLWDKFFDHVTDGGVSSNIRDIQSKAEDYLKVYRTEAEQKAPLWSLEHIFSDKMFEELGDLFGFSTGAYLSGALTGSTFGSGILGGLATTAVSALGESNIEAYHAAEEFMDSQFSNLSRQKDEELYKIDLNENMSEDERRLAYADIEHKYDVLNQEVLKGAKDIGKYTFLGNMAILAPSNFLAFGKTWFRGNTNKAFNSVTKSLAELDNQFANNLITKEAYDAARAPLLNKRKLLSESLVPDVSKNIVLSRTEHSLLATPKLSKAASMLKIARGRLREGFEEISQVWVSNTNKDYYDDIISTLNQTGLSERGEEGFLKRTKDALEQGLNTAKDPDAWYEFAMGTLLGTTGTLAFQRKENGKIGLVMAGNIYSDIKEERERFARVQELVDEANKLFETPKFQARIKYAMSAYEREAKKDEALRSGDVAKYKALEEAGIAEDIALFVKMGKLNYLKEIYEERKDLNDEAIQELINLSTSISPTGEQTGRYIDVDGNAMSIDKVREDINNSSQFVLDAIETYETKKGQLNSSPIPLSEETISHLALLETARMVASNSNLQDKEGLFLTNIGTIKDYIHNKLDKVIASYEERIKEADDHGEEYSNKLKAELKQVQELKGTLNNIDIEGKVNNLESFNQAVNEYNNLKFQEASVTSEKLNLIDRSQLFNSMLQVGSYLDILESKEDKDLRDKAKQLEEAIKNQDKDTADKLNKEVEEALITRDNKISSILAPVKLVEQRDELLKGIDKIYDSLINAELEIARQEQEKEKRKEEKKEKENKQEEEGIFREIIEKEDYTEYANALRGLPKDKKKKFNDDVKAGLYGEEAKNRYLNFLSNSNTIKGIISKVKQANILNNNQLSDLEDYLFTLENNEDIISLKGIEDVEDLKDKADVLKSYIDSVKDSIVSSSKEANLMPEQLNTPVENLDVELLDSSVDGEELPIGDPQEDLQDNTQEEDDVNNLPVGFSMDDYLSRLAAHNADVLASLIAGKGETPVWVQIIPQYGLSELKVGLQSKAPLNLTYIPFPESSGYEPGTTNQGYKIVYDYLVREGAFEYVNNGNLSVGSRVVFGLNPTAIEGSPSPETTIFMYHVTNDGKYQVIGVLPEFNKKPITGLKEFRASLLKAHTEDTSKIPGNPWIYTHAGTPVHTTIATINGGNIQFDPGVYRDLNTVEHIKEAIASNRAFFGIVRDGVMTYPKRFNSYDLLMPREILNRNGSIYLYIKGADGVFIPTLVETKIYDDPNSDIGRELEKELNRFLTAKSSGSRIALGIKRDLLYLPGNNVTFDKSDKVPNKLMLKIRTPGKPHFEKWVTPKEAAIELSKYGFKTQMSSKVVGDNTTAEDVIQYLDRRGSMYKTNLATTEIASSFFTLNPLDNNLNIVEVGKSKPKKGSVPKTLTTGEGKSLSTISHNRISRVLPGEGFFVYDKEIKQLYRRVNANSDQLEVVDPSKAKDILERIIILNKYDKLDPVDKARISYGGTYFVSSTTNDKGVKVAVVRLISNGKIVKDTNLSNVIISQFTIKRSGDNDKSNTYVSTKNGKETLYVRSSAFLSNLDPVNYYEAPTGNTGSAAIEAGSIIDLMVRLMIEGGYTNLREQFPKMSDKAFEDIYDSVKAALVKYRSKGWIVLGNRVVISGDFKVELNKKAVESSNHKAITGIAGETDLLLYNPVTKKFKIVDVKTSAKNYATADLTKYKEYNEAKHSSQVYLYKYLLVKGFNINQDDIEVGEILPIHLEYTSKKDNNTTKLVEITGGRVWEGGTITTNEDLGFKGLTNALAKSGLSLSKTGDLMYNMTSTPTTIARTRSSITDDSSAKSKFKFENALDIFSMALAAEGVANDGNNSEGKGSEVNASPTQTPTQVGEISSEDLIDLNDLGDNDENGGTSTPTDNANLFFQAALATETGSTDSAGGLNTTNTEASISTPSMSTFSMPQVSISPVNEKPESVQPEASGPKLVIQRTSRGRRGNKDNNTKPRVVSTEFEHNNNYPTLEKELAWLDKALSNLSKSNRVVIINDLIRVGNKGTKAWGLFTDGMVVISKQGAAGTVYHEAFHYVFNTLLDNEDRIAILNELVSGNPKYKGLTISQLEEILAEEFREYMMTRDSYTLLDRIKDFFRRLFMMVTNWGKIDTQATSLFRAIRRGDFTYSEAIPTYIQADKVMTAEQLEYINKYVGIDKFYELPRAVQDNMLMCM